MRSLTVIALSIAGVTFADEPVKTASKQSARFPVLDNDEAWKRLPAVEETSSKILPLWARSLAKSLPETTAVMLEQDYAYRTSEAFDPRLRAKMRWVAARANQCDYSRAYAEADLRRLGAKDSEIQELNQRTAATEPKEQAALEFAQKMTLAAYSVTDEEVEDLIGLFGEKAFVAMVLQMAFANFQDRILLALSVPIEPEGPLPPISIRFVPRKPDKVVESVPRPAPVDSPADDVPVMIRDLDWTSLSFEQLQGQLEQQRSREPRIRVPTFSEAVQLLPPGMVSPDRPVRIKWSLAIMANQPDLAMLWLRGLGTFGREANQDRIFEETLFWVVTRSLQCFY